MIKINHKRDKCIGCSSCVSICPENWIMASDNKAKPKQTTLNDIGCNQKAADSCPVKCIHIEKA